MTRLMFKLRYYWRKACRFVGLCPECGNTVNYTRNGRAICPYCSR